VPSTVRDNWPQMAVSLMLATTLYYFTFYRSRRGGGGQKAVGGSILSLKPPARYASTTVTPADTAEGLAASMECSEATATTVLRGINRMWSTDRTVGFSNEDPSHEQYLRTLYEATTIPPTVPQQYPYTRRGADLWGLLGFQGEDPATDLRGGGILALRQYTVFCTASKLLSGSGEGAMISSADKEVINLSRQIVDTLSKRRALGKQGGLTSDAYQMSLLEVLDVVIADGIKKVKPLVTRVPSSHPKPIPAATTASSLARGGLHDAIVLFNSREHTGGGSSWYLEACVSIQFTVQMLQDAVRKLHPALSATIEPSATTTEETPSPPSAQEPPKKKPLLRKVQPSSAAVSPPSPTTSTSPLKLPNPPSPADIALSSEMLRYLFSEEEESQTSNSLAIRLGVLHYLLFGVMHALWVRQRPHVMEYQTFMQEVYAPHGIEMVSRALWIWQRG
jgi:hypothetical protein